MTTAIAQHAPIRVAIVDDSRSIRRWLRTLLEADPRMQVVAEASDGVEAWEALSNTPIDIVTLDVDMPRMSGMELLSRVMAHRPMPVVMLSALTEAGSCEAVRALSLGAVDCIEKPRSALSEEVITDIRERIFLASQTQVYAGFRAKNPRMEVPSSKQAKSWSGPVILLGASTGGVSALETLLTELEGNPCPVVIAQHMPMDFLRSFCRRLNAHFSRNFVMAQDGHVLQSGQAVISIGKDVSTRLVTTKEGNIKCVIGPPSDTARFHPCVDDLFASATKAGLRGCAALLTGMGNDGAAGLRDLRDIGFYTLAQKEDSCVVFGMPKAAIALGAVDATDDPQGIGRKLFEKSTAMLALAKGTQ